MEALMFDLETAGTRSNAAIMQIGACIFDDETGEISAKFIRNVNLQSGIDAGLTVDGHVIRWWMRQGDKAIASLENPAPVDLKEAIADFHEFIIQEVENHEKLVAYCHANFDFPILISACDATGTITRVIKYTQLADVRTIVRLAYRGSIVDHPCKNGNTGVRHNALDDAVFQAQYITDSLQSIRRGR